MPILVTQQQSYMPWQPPQIEHSILPDIGEPSEPDNPPTIDDPPGADVSPRQDEPPGAPTHWFPTRQGQPPDYYRPQFEWVYIDLGEDM